MSSSGRKSIKQRLLDIIELLCPILLIEEEEVKLDLRNEISRALKKMSNAIALYSNRKKCLTECLPQFFDDLERNKEVFLFRYFSGEYNSQILGVLEYRKMRKVLGRYSPPVIVLPRSNDPVAWIRVKLLL